MLVFAGCTLLFTYWLLQKALSPLWPCMDKWMNYQIPVKPLYFNHARFKRDDPIPACKQMKYFKLYTNPNGSDEALEKIISFLG